jgi:hypothetical protein
MGAVYIRIQKDVCERSRAEVVRVWGLGFRVWGLGFRFRVKSLEFRVACERRSALGFRV